MVYQRQERLQTLDESSPNHIIAVIIENSEGAADRHKGDAGFDQTPGQQSALAQAVAAIDLANPLRLLIDPERLPRLAGHDNFQCLPAVMVHPVHGVAGVEVAAQVVELPA